MLTISPHFIRKLSSIFFICSLLISVQLLNSCTSETSTDPGTRSDTAAILTDDDITALNEEVRVLTNSGQFRAADSILTNALATAEAQGMKTGVIQIITELAYLKAVSGRVQAGIDLLESYRDIVDENSPDRLKFFYHLRLSSLYNAATESAIALEMIDMALDNAPEDISMENYITAISTKATILGAVYRYPEAIELYQQAISLGIEHKTSESNLATAYNNLGLALHNLSRYEQSLVEYARSYEINTRINNVVGIGLNLNNIANSLDALGFYEAAIDTLLSAVALNQRNNNPGSLVRNYYNLGKITAETGDYEVAEDYYQSAYELSTGANFTPGILYSSTGLAQIHAQKGDHRRAIELASGAKILAENLNSLDILKENLLTLKNSLEAIGDLRGAIEMYKLYEETNDSLWAIRNIEEVRSSYAFDILENEKDILEQQLMLSELQVRRQLLYLVLSLVVVIGVGLYYYMLRQKNLQIASKNLALEQLHDEKDILTKVIVHDMRNPLTALLGAIDLMSHDGQLNGDQQDYVNLALKSGQKLKYMINGLLNVSEIKQESMSEDITGTDVHKLTLDIVDSLAGSAEIKGITITTDVEKIVRKTHAEYLKHIIDNLLSNAIKFSPINSTVSVEVKSIDETRWSVKVKDQGPGFSKKDKEDAFKMFQKLSAKPTNGEDSTGLGLYLVHLLTSKLGGTIEIHSTEGKGSTIECAF